MKNLFLNIFIALILIACKTDVDEKVIAKVGNQNLTLAEIKRESNSNNLTDEQINQSALRWINDELLYQEALSRNLDDEAEELINESKKRILINLLIEKEINSFSSEMVNDSLAKNYYNENKKIFSAPNDFLWLSFVLISNKDDANSFRAEAIRSNNWDETKEQHFNLINYNEDSVLFSEKTLYLQDAWKIGKILRNGEVSIPIKSQNQYFIFKKLGIFYEGNNLPIQTVKKEIKDRIVIETRNKKYSELLKKLKTEATVSLTTQK